VLGFASVATPISDVARFPTRRRSVPERPCRTPIPGEHPAAVLISGDSGGISRPRPSGAATSAVLIGTLLDDTLNGNAGEMNVIVGDTVDALDGMVGGDDTLAGGACCRRKPCGRRARPVGE
jgi:hypothetical protein